MAQSLAKNYLHIIFSTKYREKMISEAIEDRLFNYLGGTCSALGCDPIKIGGYDDHVHILCILSKKIACCKLLEEVKSHSSKWIKTIGPSLQHFYWQDGYGAFSVSPAGIDSVRRYISNQRAHHNAISFQDEYRLLLKKNKIDYDEKYVWD